MTDGSMPVVDASAPQQPVCPPGRGTAWRLWPDVPSGAPPAVFAAVLVSAAVTVLTEPYAVVGVAGLLTGLTVAAAPVAVVATWGAARRRLARPLPVAAGVTSLILLAVGTVRAAGWLYALCLLTALALASYGLAGGRRWPSVLATGVVVPIGLLRAMSWLGRGVKPSVRVGDGVGTGLIRLFAVVVGTGLLLLVFGSLFASADVVFGNAVARLVPDVPPVDLVVRGFFAALVAGFALGAAYVARVPPRLDRIAAGNPRRVRRAEWLVPLVALVGLFSAFVAVQTTTLFGGDAHVLRTAGLTYAEYARQGFGQLVVVTSLTLGVLAAVARWAPRRSRVDRSLLRLVPGALCLLTLVIVASALYRLHLYQQAYGFTRLRLWVDTFEVWLGVVFMLILVAGVRLRAAWLPRAVVATGVAVLLGLAALNPDAFIADRNLARPQGAEPGDQRIDTDYLGHLSADAVPVLHRLPEPQRSCALAPIAADLARADRWYEYNAARERARALLADHPVDPDVHLQTDCGSGGRR